MQSHPFIDDRRGLSEVIATTILIVVTVLASAAVYAIWNLVADPADEVTTVGMHADEHNDRLVVLTAPSDADWNRLAVRAEPLQPGIAVYLGAAGATVEAPAGLGGTDVVGGAVPVTDASRPIISNEFLEFCANPAAVDVRVEITDLAANAFIGRWTFSTVAAC